MNFHRKDGTIEDMLATVPMLTKPKTPANLMRMKFRAAGMSENRKGPVAVVLDNGKYRAIELSQWPTEAVSPMAVFKSGYCIFSKEKRDIQDY